MMGILSVEREPLFEDSITHFEYHTHAPYASTRYGNNDEIRIPIQQQDIFTLPTESLLYIEGRLSKKSNVSPDTALNVKLINNAMGFLFEEIRYELAGVEVDRTKNVGITSTLKALLSIKERNITSLQNAGWVAPTANEVTLTSDGDFNFCLPLKMLMGFAEDYTRIVLGLKQDLVLLRTSTNLNAMVSTSTEANGVLELTKVNWMMPYVHVANTYRLRLLDFVHKDRPLTMSFRSWELHEYPALPETSRQTWTVKTSSQLEKPRFVVLAFQTARKNNLKKHTDEFNHCKVTNAKLFLNDKYYPYDNMHLDIDKGRFALLYDMYARFQNSYYHRYDSVPLLTPDEFKTKAPLIVFDCSRQDDSLKSAAVDVRLEFESRENFPAQTTAYCMILHDSLVEYTPLSNTVRRLT